MGSPWPSKKGSLAWLWWLLLPGAGWLRGCCSACIGALRETAQPVSDSAAGREAAAPRQNNSGWSGVSEAPRSNPRNPTAELLRSCLVAR